jgi:hypothetical protein
MAFMGIFIGIFCLYYYLKMKYLLKNYEKMKCYETILDRPSTSYEYRGALYYTVVINDSGVSKQVSTNPYFSSSFTSIYHPEDFNNKKVIGLYDAEMDKFYIIKKIN